MRTLGAFLVAFGIIALAFGSIDYTKHEAVLDAGPVHATVDQKKRIPLPPLAGGAAVVLGITLMSRKSREI